MSKRARREAITFYLLILPWLLGLVGYSLGPMVASAYLSLTRWSILQPPVFVGLQNYALLFQDPLFWQSLKVTVLYALGSVTGSLAVALTLAVLLNQKVRGLAWFRTIFYLPSVVSGVAVSVLFLWVFNPDFGLANQVLGWLHLPPQKWIASPTEALPSLILMSCFSVGGTMIIFLAGLQNIPQQLLEAAELDGAGSWQRFWRITIPMLSPTIFFNLVVSIIGALQTFTQGYVMTGGGPMDATLFYVLYLYTNAFTYLKMGYASAMAWVLFLLILGLTLLVVRSGNRWVYYEAGEAL